MKLEQLKKDDQGKVEKDKDGKPIVDKPAVVLAYGKFLQAIFDSLIIAFCVFLMVTRNPPLLALKGRFENVAFAGSLNARVVSAKGTVCVPVIFERSSAVSTWFGAKAIRT